MRLLLIAIQFLTIIPVPFPLRCEERDLGRSMAFFPLAGLFLGALLVGADFVLTLRLPRPVADLLLITLLSVVTGALHLDGLADVCDGLTARGGRERFLVVMKDSRIGAVGVVGLVLALLLKFEALLHIPLDCKREALLFFPLVARFSQVQITLGAERARVDGLGSAFIGTAGMWQFVSAGVITLAGAWLLLGLRGIYCCVALYLCTWVLKWWFHRKLGGGSPAISSAASAS